MSCGWCVGRRRKRQAIGPQAGHSAGAATVVWNMGNKAGKEHTGPEFGEGGKEANWAGLGPLEGLGGFGKECE